MMFKSRLFLLGAAVSAFVFVNASGLHAATIIKLNLGNVGPDLSMNAVGILGTVGDGVGVTTGDQNTAVLYTDFLDPIPDISASVASVSLSNLSAVGPANLASAGLVIQNFSGGMFSLFDPSNTLLLSGSLTSSSLIGVLGPSATGSVLSIGVASVTGGVLAPFIMTNSLGLSIALTNVNGGAGFSVTGPVLNPSLNPFFADSIISISGAPTELGGQLPEPATFALATLALAVGATIRRRTH